MKYLIVNGDDFGLSPGVNRGILEAHRHGILTSASLLVDTPWSEEAARLSRTVPALSVGLHAHLRGAPRAADDATGRAELARQLRRFRELMGRPPTHLDSHHNLHRERHFLPQFIELAGAFRLPLRDQPPIHHLSKFHGRWGGESHVEQVRPDALLRLLDGELDEGVTELACHPGHVDAALRSGYAVERETELETLCHPMLPRALDERGIRRISFFEARDLLSMGP
jgi:chitin disaccharide deacetylase